MRHNKGVRVMTGFRGRMEKILDQQENDTIVTNPKERFRTFFRKMAYRMAVAVDWIRRLFTHHPDESRR